MAFRLLKMQAWISWIVFNQLFSDALHQRPRCSAGEADLELGQIKGFHQPKDGTWKRLYHMTGWKLQPPGIRVSTQLLNMNMMIRIYVEMIEIETISKHLKFAEHALPCAGSDCVSLPRYLCDLHHGWVGGQVGQVGQVDDTGDPVGVERYLAGRTWKDGGTKEK